MRSKPLPDGHPAYMGLRSLKAFEYPCEAAGAAGILAPKYGGDQVARA